MLEKSYMGEVMESGGSMDFIEASQGTFEQILGII